MKNAFDGIISRLDIAKERIWARGYIKRTLKSWKAKRTKIRKTEENIQGMSDNYKRCNMCIMGIKEGEQWEKGTDEIFETTTDNFPKLMSDTKWQFHQSSVNTMQNKWQKTIPRHTISKLQKIKDKKKFLKEARGKKHLTYRRIRIRIISKYSETIQTRKK